MRRVGPSGAQGSRGGVGGGILTRLESFLEAIYFRERERRERIKVINMNPR